MELIVPVSGGEIWAEDTGGNGTPLVLVHPVGLGLATWAPAGDDAAARSQITSAVSTFLADRDLEVPPPAAYGRLGEVRAPTVMVRGDREYPMVAECSDVQHQTGPWPSRLAQPAMAPSRCSSALLIGGRDPNTSRNSASRASREGCWSAMIDLLPSRTASAAADRTASSEAAARDWAMAATSASRAESSCARQAASSSSSGPGPSIRPHRPATPSPSDPLMRSRSGRRLAAGSKGS